MHKNSETFTLVKEKIFTPELASWRVNSHESKASVIKIKCFLRWGFKTSYSKSLVLPPMQQWHLQGFQYLQRNGKGIRFILAKLEFLQPQLTAQLPCSLPNPETRGIGGSWGVCIVVTAPDISRKCFILLFIYHLHIPFTFCFNF